MPSEFQIERGFPEDQRAVAGRLFWQAFRGKLGKVLAPEVKALQLCERLLNPEFALSALAEDGELLGMAGFKTSEGALVDGTLDDLRSVYGLWGGFWRGFVLDLLERETSPDQLLMDGIFVSANARGQGIGRALLEAVCEEATQQGLSSVRLDVIDTNPRARALYERAGFEAVSTEQTGPFKHLFGFSEATRMERQL
ncbi:MAG: GNAT family N-acetyltransferase [Roseibium sp.]|uniref:GNAT family N-acetyltransferase n=1 Tax=Roseibium sp. TaxID=1936156 RepID=UPI0026317346|nr:GNAT family N-acetyltransferase [Roseibium sp.]MCV0427122.1 GNAT family N-acetyltransferase [Roseibium sp.]